jgi:hypothetical protein
MDYPAAVFRVHISSKWKFEYYREEKEKLKEKMGEVVAHVEKWWLLGSNTRL